MSLESDGGMILTGENRRTWRKKPVPVPLCPAQIPRGLSRVRTRASAVRGRRLTTWAMARPQTASLNKLQTNNRRVWETCISSTVAKLQVPCRGCTWYGAAVTWRAPDDGPCWHTNWLIMTARPSHDDRKLCTWSNVPTMQNIGRGVTPERMA
jgi:hypothetical protein